VLSLELAKELLRLGRRAILCALKDTRLEVPASVKLECISRAGVFTTLRTYPEGRLRGCVGVLPSQMPLWRGVVHSSTCAALRDPRFPPLSVDELNRVTLEISLLGDFEEVKGYPPTAFEIGMHGLYVERSGRRGLLLPQVALHHSWTQEEFLEQACLKAGLDRNSWREKDVKIYRFSAEIYEEVEPCGEVRKVNPSE